MFDINEVRVSGKVISINKGEAKDKGPYVNVYIETQGKKYADLIHCSFYGENALSAAKDLSEGTKILVSGKLIGKKVIDVVTMKLVGNYYFIVA